MKGGYRLTDEALKIINKPAMRRELMDILEVTEFTIARYIQNNNRMLTDYAVLELISKESGLPMKQLLRAKGNSKIKINPSLNS